VRARLALVAAVAMSCTSDDASTGAARRERPATPGIVFDPAAVREGDTVAGLRVAAHDVRRASDGAPVGTVRFQGLVAVRGRTMAHPDPDVADPCFLADSASSARLPRWAGDARRSWFCFANAADARALLGAPGESRVATITVDDFTIHYAPSDVVNSARLLRAR
jgi:hypothetical protein